MTEPRRIAWSGVWNGGPAAAPCAQAPCAVCGGCWTCRAFHFEGVVCDATCPQRRLGRVAIGAEIAAESLARVSNIEAFPGGIRFTLENDPDA